jgi:hypothetical protein
MANAPKTPQARLAHRSAVLSAAHARRRPYAAQDEPAAPAPHPPFVIQPTPFDVPPEPKVTNGQA